MLKGLESGYFSQTLGHSPASWGLRQPASESVPVVGEVGGSETIGCSRGSSHSYAPVAPPPLYGRCYAGRA